MAESDKVSRHEDEKERLAQALSAFQPLGKEERHTLLDVMRASPGEKGDFLMRVALRRTLQITDLKSFGSEEVLLARMRTRAAAMAASKGVASIRPAAAEPVPFRIRRAETPGFFRDTRKLAAAACIVGAAVALGGIWGWQEWWSWAGYRAVEFARSVELEDGSEVALRPDSFLQVRYSEDLRELRLKSGAATFTVHKDQARKFVVTAGEWKVVAVGTQFDLEWQQDTVQVTVDEGRVQVYGANRTSPQTQLGAGQATRLSPRGVMAAVSSEILSDTGGTGDTGSQRVTREKLADVAERFNKAESGVTLLVLGAAREERINGVIGKDLEAFLRTLETQPEFVIERKDNVVTVRLRKEAGR